MLEAESIEDRWLGEFTNGAREAKIPVVLGGHSLVSGGMLALIDAAWGDSREDPIDCTQAVG